MSKEKKRVKIHSEGSRERKSDSENTYEIC